MAWITPVYNRTATSKYNVTDLNRVRNNIEYMEDYLQSYLGISTSLLAYTTQTKILLPDIVLLNNTETNINALLTSLGSIPTGWITLLASWIADTQGEFIWSDANALEKDLELLKAKAEEVAESVLFTGTYYCSTTANQGELVTEEGLT